MAEAPRSIDATLVKAMQDNVQAPVQAAVPVPEVAAPPAQETQEPGIHDAVPQQPLPPRNDPPPQEEAAPQSLPEAAHASPPVDGGSPIDEYGNPVAKPRTYTEEEVQRMIRDRLSRGRQAEGQPSPATSPSPQAAPQAQEGEADWEAQLEQFVEKTIEKKQARTRDEQYRQQELQRQAEFESRFTSGMGRYGDFHAVVSNKPITDSMMVATRALEDPAAFIYGASRMHPQELERIARIADPIAVAAEVGRLHERMVKERRALSSAPRPVEVPKGDMPRNDDSRVPIDTLIAQHEQRRFARR